MVGGGMVWWVVAWCGGWWHGVVGGGMVWWVVAWCGGWWHGVVGGWFCVGCVVACRVGWWGGIVGCQIRLFSMCFVVPQLFDTA